MERILLLEDDTISGKLTSRILTKYNFDVTWVRTGDLFLTALHSNAPHVVIIDNVPEQSCFETCSILHTQRNVFNGLIMIYSGCEDESDMVSLLELGADDYITKGLSPRVVVARIRSHLRRNPASQTQERKKIEWGPIQLHPTQKKILVDGHPIGCTQSEFELFYLLASTPGSIQSRNEIIQALHGKNYSVTKRTVDVFIANLRKKLGPHGHMIRTIRGMGYQFEAPKLSKAEKYDRLLRS